MGAYSAWSFTKSRMGFTMAPDSQKGDSKDYSIFLNIIFFLENF